MGIIILSTALTGVQAQRAGEVELCPLNPEGALPTGPSEKSGRLPHYERLFSPTHISTTFPSSKPQVVAPIYFLLFQPNPYHAETY